MAYSGILLNALTYELQNKLIGGRINKIYQPSEEELTFTIHNNGKNHLLYISINSNYAHVNILDQKLENPQKPPNFCMLLRKHLQNGFILNIKQLEFERILIIEINSSDELGYSSTKRLIIEIMGKHSNAILINEDDIIYDSLKRISPFMSKVRQIMPNQPFKFIEFDKENLLNLTKEGFKDSLYEYEKEKVYRFLYINYQGFGPPIAKEICNRCSINFNNQIKDLSQGEKDILYSEISKLKELIENKNFKPLMILNTEDHSIKDLVPFHFESYSGEDYFYKEYTHFSNLINDYYSKKIKANTLKQKSGNLISLLNKKIELLKNKVTNLNKDLTAAKNAKDYQIKGELLTANIYKIEKGMDFIKLENYYNNKLVEIQLKPNKTPAENAQYYYKKYNKLKTAQKQVSIQLKQTKEELAYCENLLNSIENAEDLETIENIKLEMIEGGYINKKSKNKKSKSKIKDNFKKFISSDGFIIYAGKNNKQNDYLTLKFANKNDLWFHTKDLAGTHVILKTKGEKVPQLALDEAAIVAAYNSKGKMSSNVPVDYTKVKNVSKPSGAKPGMVIYDNNKTLYVTPNLKIIEQLKNNKIDS